MEHIRLKRERMDDHHAWLYQGAISEEEARMLQAESGYHPHGYGFFEFRLNTDGTTSWKCWDSCD
jgi:hypothetical protein